MYLRDNIQKVLLILLLLIVVPFATWYGFDEEPAKILQCKVTSEKYVLAEYSATETTINADGTLSTDTDYWSEPASEVYKTINIDGELTFQSHNFNPSLTTFGYYMPPMPKVWNDFVKDYDFDNFSYKNEAWLTVSVKHAIGADFSNFKASNSAYKKCIEKLDNYVPIKTWYGISYDSEF